MRKKPTLIVAGLVVAGIGGALGGTTTVGASAPVASAPTGGAIDCAAIASSFGGDLPESLATFYSAVNVSNSQIATADTPLTLFIPANSAFDKIPSNVLDSIVADSDLLTSILDYHLILDQALSSADLAAAGTETSAEGDPLTFAMSGDTLTINDGQAAVVCPDLEVQGAVIHVIDGVLTPPSLATAGSGCATGSSGPSSSGPASSAPASSTPSSAAPGSSVPCTSTPVSAAPSSSTP